MDYAGMKVLIMGLGLHGGGLESARFLLKRGAELTVTDLRDEQTLAPSIEQLEAACKNGSRRASVRYVLGKHEIDDFKNTDMVIKNPGVAPDSPFLQAARRIETDISLFLDASFARLTAVTGSKGKSTTASALHWVLAHSGAKETGSTAYLGGNITVSPLTFLDDLREDDDVVLELSSWQLGDLRSRCRADGSPLLKPKAAVLTAIMPDHLDRYGSMAAYVADKRVIYQGQDSTDFTVAGDDEWGRGFLAESKAVPLMYSRSPVPEGVAGGWIEGTDGPGYARLNDGKLIELVPARLLVPGRHQKQNLLAAGLALLGLGLSAETIRKNLETFPGVEHRLELFHQAGGITFYNDSAATIPEAAAAALEALGGGTDGGHLILVTGGTDKSLDFSPLVQAVGQAQDIILLAGSGSEKLCALFDNAGITYHGPFDALDKAVIAARESAVPGDRIALSPGCASFGMFLNEFDRGRKWKEAVRRLA
ncbi:MAG: UDP-N-acetylmuramoyl-L-alanine--D-glutamate ligase [Treponema sp.]|nr:UDP-N-acetylmuramoyl-L-alanine--D-glutamate ligase [Treponema sp.]